MAKLFSLAGLDRETKLTIANLHFLFYCQHFQEQTKKDRVLWRPLVYLDITFNYAEKNIRWKILTELLVLKRNSKV